MTDRFLALTVPFRHSSWGTFIQLLLLTLVPGSLCAANPTITVQVSSETAPPGGTAQFKIALSAPALVSTAAISMTFDPTIFGPILNVAAFSATGDQAGYANVNGQQLTASVSSSSASLGQLPDLPIFVVTVPVLQGVTSTAATVTVDPTLSPWQDQQGDTYTVNVIPGTLTLGGSLSIQSVIPGGGVLPSATIVSVNGTGFDASTTAAIDGVSIASTQFVNARQINVTLAGATELTGKHLHVTTGAGAQSDFFCSLSSAPANVSPTVFPLLPLTTYTNVAWDRPDDADYNESAVLLNQSLTPVTVTFFSVSPNEFVTVLPSITIAPGNLYLLPLLTGLGPIYMLSSAPIRMIEYRVDQPLVPPYTPQESVFPPTVLANTLPPIASLLQFTAYPSAAAWTWQIGSATPSPVVIDLEGGLPFTVTISNAPWLTVSPTQGTAPATVTFTPNVSALGAGPYSGTVTIHPILLSSLSALTVPDLVLPVSIQVGPTSFITAEPPGLFNAPVGSLTPITGTFSVSTAGAIAKPSVSVNTNSGGNWLSATPTTGFAPGTVTVTLNPAGLPSGAYLGTVIVQGPLNSVTVPVELNVGLNPPPLAANPSTLTFALAAGATSLGSQLVILSQNYSTSSVATQSGGNWLTASLTVMNQVSASASAVGLSPGTYLGTITVTSTAGASLQIPVILTVLTPSAPLTVTPLSVSLTTPAAQSVTQTFNVSSTPSTLFSFTVFTPGPERWWYGGSTSSPSAPSTVTLTFLSTQPGTHYGSVIFTSGSNSVTVPIVLTVAASATSPPILASVVSAGSGLPSAISPGEIITLYGTGLGLTTPRVVTILPGGGGGDAIPYTNVLIDNGTVGQTYASSSQLNVIVPSGTPSTGAATVQVIIDGAYPTATWSVPLAPSAPSIFTISGSGIGPGAIVNQDGSINSPTNPASRGTAIQIYGTGGGPTSPPSYAGNVAQTAASLTLPVTVTIGGVNAQVLYAGNAPGEVVGLVQINALIPQSVTPGTALPLLVTIGGVAAQAGVTVAIQ
jgi:uncharacterized protein (TIGR03437 family)